MGDKLSMQERRACVRKIIENITNGLTQKTNAGADPTKAGAKPDFGDAALTALTFSVKLPGKIVSTNGERDDFNREVYWSVYPQAAVLGDVEMTGQSGGGMVTALMNGKGELKKITLDKSAVDPDDIEMLEDLIIAAVADAKNKVETHIAAETQKMMGGLPMPPGMKLPF